MNQKIVYSLFAAILIIVLSWLGYQKFASKTPKHHDLIFEYDDARDREAVIALFKASWWILIAGREYSREYVENMLDKRTPNKNPLLIGSLRFKSLRVNNELAGFTAYYMEKKERGRLLFLVIDEKHRSKGYGELLAKVAIQELQNLGAKKVWLLTRASNVKAQRLYRKIGFHEYEYDPDGFVYFEIP